MSDSPIDTETRNIRIWDIWVRLFHWSLVASVGFLLLSGQTGWKFIDWHRLTGEFVLALIVFRVLWGIAGSSNARLSTLLRSPVAGLRHLRQLVQRRPPPERGHNAAGSWAVVIMLLLLSIQAITGSFIADEDEWVEGAWYGSLSDSATDLAYRIHHLNAELIQVVIAVHILMVFVYLLYARMNLIRPMITGWMKWPASEPLPTVTLQRAWVGALLIALAMALVGYLAGWYP